MFLDVSVFVTNALHSSQYFIHSYKLQTLNSTRNENLTTSPRKEKVFKKSVFKVNQTVNISRLPTETWYFDEMAS